MYIRFYEFRLYSGGNMNRDQVRKAARVAYINQQIARNPNRKITAIVRDLADRLFLSTATIWKDIKRRS